MNICNHSRTYEDIMDNRPVTICKDCGKRLKEGPALSNPNYRRNPHNAAHTTEKKNLAALLRQGKRLELYGAFIA